MSDSDWRPGVWPRFDRPADCWEQADRLVAEAAARSGALSQQQYFQEALRLEIRALTLQLRHNNNVGPS